MNANVNSISYYLVWAFDDSSWSWALLNFWNLEGLPYFHHSNFDQRIQIQSIFIKYPGYCLEFSIMVVVNFKNFSCYDYLKYRHLIDYFKHCFDWQILCSIIIIEYFNFWIIDSFLHILKRRKNEIIIWNQGFQFLMQIILVLKWRLQNLIGLFDYFRFFN